MGPENTQGTVSNFLVPSVQKASDDEVAELCKKMGITKKDLPLVKLNDATLQGIEVGVDDVVKILRKSWVSDKETTYYRRVVP